MPKELWAFTKEFKGKAVHLVQTSGKSITPIVYELEIVDISLHH